MRAPSSTLNSRTRAYSALGAAALFSGALAYVGLVDPHRPSSIFPACPFKLLTGWNCPACGGLRMTHDLLHGDFAAAAVDNVFLLVGLPALLAWILVRWRAQRPIFTAPAIVVIVVLAVTWTVARNLPGFPLVPTVLGG
ncbi:hypothetical protein CQY20_25735 [Mycolicibacterium agri]|uniref:Membrane protein n=1 Tax=Mycolicibacterium agri TaxID=36811 RepID=A0A2A7MSR6_MYCAG|nr:DUF2752 domain-containing protein [Mycolicibacterium agri]PEG34381.1 hypothetical protein CQY20_25735 [Mycolicibacterium agri]GFG49080.1 membrane protein [Mycolicibacterium agri]